MPAMHQTTSHKAFGRIWCCPLRFVMRGADLARLDTPVCDVVSPVLHGEQIWPDWMRLCAIWSLRIGYGHHESALLTVQMRLEIEPHQQKNNNTAIQQLIFFVMKKYAPRPVRTWNKNTRIPDPSHQDS